jgi:hypothetical protein
MSMAAKIKLFVSHATVDAPVVKAFLHHIESGIGVPPKDIFCTANKGQGIRTGTEFKSSIREKLDNATTVIALISENYYNSPFSMCELGGCWLQAKDFIPVLIPPLRFADMKAVLVGLQATRIAFAEDLDELRDEISERLSIKPLPTPRWSERRDEFIKILPKKLRELPKSPVVSRERLVKAEAVAAEYEASLKEAHERSEKLQRTISKLKKAKDVKTVSAIEREEMEAADVFDELVQAASVRLSALSSITREAIFASQRGEDYYPGRPSSDYRWDDANRPLQYKEIELNSEEDGIQPNHDNPDVRKAIDALDELDLWLSDKAPADFFEWYPQQHNGREPDLKDRNFWDKHLW